MVEYILGDYLVETGKLTSVQLETIVEKMDKVRVKLGLIAVVEGMMTMEQADEVNRLQAIMDKRFGDIAVEKGYLTDEQIGNLLKTQGNTYLAFSQVLVDADILSLEEMERVLEDFRVKHSFSKTDMEMLKSDDPDKIVPLYLSPETLEFGEWIGVVVRTMIRCIDRHIYIGKADLTKSTVVSKGAMQVVDGEGGKTTAFADVQGGLLDIASIFGQADFTEMDEDALDAVGEFLNCVNGLHVSALSQKGVSLELLPPELIEDDKEFTSEKICNIPIFVKGKELKFLVL
ncbi:MAG: chemotaxis protein CheX [Clostridiales bacterium]|nr:chemotaxis protein CheX [Clostridiales bacterium]